MEVPSHVSESQFRDLPMFLSGVELKNYVTNSVDNDRYPIKPDTKRAMDRLWEEKEEESTLDPSEGFDGGGVYESIRQNGFNWEHPVDVYHDKGLRIMVDGHHRVAAAARLEQETGTPIWIPIKHSG